MSDSATVSGKVSSASDLTDEEYRLLCRKVKAHQMKNGKKKRSKPLLKPLGDINTINLSIKVQKSPIDWDDLKIGMPFSLDDKASMIYVKTGKERAISLNTMSPISTSGASVFRVFL